MIVHGVKNRRRGGRHPRRARARFRMSNLGLHHLPHLVRHRPHPFPDLPPAAEAGLHPHVHVPVLVRRKPGLRPDVRLRMHRTGFHARMDLVASTVQETCIDEHHTIPCLTNRRFQVYRGPALFIHNADLERIALQSQRRFHAFEQIDRGRDLIRAVQFGFHDVNAARAAVDEFAFPLQIVFGRKCGHHRVQEPLGNLLAVAARHAIGVHVDADVPHQQEAPSRQGEGPAVRRREFPVRIQTPRNLPVSLFEGRFQRAFHDAVPVGVHPRLVLCVHGRYRILAVLDRRHRRLQQDVIDTCRMRGAYGMVVIDADLDVKTVVHQQRARKFAPILPVPGELFGVSESDLRTAPQRDNEPLGPASVFQGNTRRLRPATGRQTRRVIQKRFRRRNHPRPPDRVVSVALFGAGFLRNHVCSVQGVVKTAPTRIRRVQRVTRIVHRHHQLRSGNARDFGIHACRGQLEMVALRHQVADVGQKCPVLVPVQGPALSLPVPPVHLLLNTIPPFQQRPVPGTQFPDDLAQRNPECSRVHIRTRSNLVPDQIVQDLANPQAANLNSHRSAPFFLFGFAAPAVKIIRSGGGHNR